MVCFILPSWILLLVPAGRVARGQRRAAVGVLLFGGAGVAVTIYSLFLPVSVLPTPYPTPAPTAFPTPYPTAFPTGYPTPYPTAYPAPSPVLASVA